jgi:SAM-dependent methyltransferase
VLEIGCGSGELAAELTHAGLAVSAIDSDAAAVERARSLGVDARILNWPGEVDAQFDAVLFTRSLHHIHDLDGAVAAAVAAVRPGGRIIVEDFRAEGGTERSSRWFVEIAGELLESGAIASATLDELADKLETTAHEHELQSSGVIERALRERLTTDVEDAAYYFRYFEPHLTEQTRADALLAAELELIERGAIDALGRRFVVST